MLLTFYKIFLIIKSFILLPLKSKNLLKYAVLFYSSKETQINYFFKRDKSLVNSINSELKEKIESKTEKYIGFLDIVAYNLSKLAGLALIGYSLYNFLRHVPVNDFYYALISLIGVKAIIELPFLLKLIFKSKRVWLLFYWLILKGLNIIIPLFFLIFEFNILERMIKKTSIREAYREIEA